MRRFHLLSNLSLIHIVVMRGDYMQKYYYFLNRKNSMDGFRESINSRFFVDKSMLIEIVSDKISTKEKWICVSRPRRFGKTMALEMLSAYYTQGMDSDFLFDNLKIKNTVGYNKHLNAHNVVCINFNDYFENHTVKEGIKIISERLVHDLKLTYPSILKEEKAVAYTHLVISGS